jgi:hypothetical protein
LVPATVTIQVAIAAFINENRRNACVNACFNIIKVNARFVRPRFSACAAKQIRVNGVPYNFKTFHHTSPRALYLAGDYRAPLAAAGVD